jgi:hypothetical protein
MDGNFNKYGPAMNNKYRLLPMLACLIMLVVSGCEDPRMNNMAEDQVYLNNFGENVQNVFKWEHFTYQLPVIKSGVGQQGGEVSLKVDEAVLANYDDKYTLLPAELYQIKAPQLTLGKSDYNAFFDIEFDAAGIEALQAKTDKRYAVPLRLSSGTIKPAADQQLCSVVVPNVLEPYIQFKTAGLSPATLSVSTANSPTETRCYAFVQTNYNNKADLPYKVQVSEAALAKYNKENGTAHKLLPAAAYKIDETSFVIANRNNEQALSYYLIKGKASNGEYMLPLEITSVSKYGINPARATMLVPVKVED